MMDHPLTRQDLRDAADDLIERVDERFEAMRSRGDERHADNVKRLDRHTEQLGRIETQCNKTNGRVDALEDLNDKRERNAPKGEDRPLTRRELAWVLVLLVGASSSTAGVVVWLLTHRVGQ